MYIIFVIESAYYYRLFCVLSKIVKSSFCFLLYLINELVFTREHGRAYSLWMRVFVRENVIDVIGGCLFTNNTYCN